MPRPTRSLSELRSAFDAKRYAFDGRLRVVAVARQSGRRVVFGAPGAPNASVATAVEASCSVPWIFAPVSIGGVEYVDGGWWSPTNLDIAPAARGSHVLCLNPTAGWRGSGVGSFAGGVSRAVMEVEAATLRGRGAHVRTVGLSRAVAAAIGPNLMDGSRREAVQTLGYEQGLELALTG
jgi:NTE family protein